MSFVDAVKKEMGWLEAELTDILSGGAVSMSISGGAEAYFLMGIPTKKGMQYLKPYAIAKAAAYRTLLEQGGSLINGEFKPWLSTHYSESVTTLNDIVSNAKLEGKTLNEIEKLLINEFDYEERYARLAAYQETKRLYTEAEFDRYKQEGVGMGIWHHMDPQDNPREEHQARDGEMFALDDPVWNELDDFNCHCWCEPVVDYSESGIKGAQGEAESRPKQPEEKLLSSTVRPVETLKDYDTVKNIWQNRQMEYTTTKATLDSRYDNAIRYRDEWMKANASGADEATKSAIYKQYSKAVDEYNAKVGEYNKLRTDIRVSARNAIFSDKLIEVTPNISTQQYKAKLDPDFIKNVRTGTDQIEKMVNLKDIDGMNIPIKMLPPEMDRAYATGDGRLFLTKDVDPAVVIHEFGHKLESSVPEIHNEALSFLERRTAGEEAKSLIELTGVKSFSADEIAKKDKFMDPYIGKLYNHEATEVVSMGMQYMYERPVEFAIKDPDHFNFILKVMGRKE